MFFKAYDIEQELLTKFKDHSHTPLIKFKGHTEAIKYDQKELLLSTLLEIVK